MSEEHFCYVENHPSKPNKSFVNCIEFDIMTKSNQNYIDITNKFKHVEHMGNSGIPKMVMTHDLINI